MEEEGVKESQVLLDSIKDDNKLIKQILNPLLKKGEGADEAYRESKIKLKESILERAKVEKQEDEERSQLLDDFEMIQEKIKELGMIKIVLEQAREDLNVIRTQLPSASKDLTMIKGLIRERENL